MYDRLIHSTQLKIQIAHRETQPEVLLMSLSTCGRALPHTPRLPATELVSRSLQHLGTYKPLHSSHTGTPLPQKVASYICSSAFCFFAKDLPTSCAKPLFPLSTSSPPDNWPSFTVTAFGSRASHSTFCYRKTVTEGKWRLLSMVHFTPSAGVSLGETREPSWPTALSSRVLLPSTNRSPTADDPPLDRPSEGQQ